MGHTFHIDIDTTNVFLDGPTPHPRMHVDLHTQQGTVGTVTLVGGSARASDEQNQEFLDSLTVVEPGSLVPLGPESGERYLRALPANLHGSYFWAVSACPASHTGARR